MILDVNKVQEKIYKKTVLVEKEGMTPKQFEEKMKEIYKPDEEGYDKEGCHIEADTLMQNILKNLGYKKGVEIFEKADKWYT